MKSRLLQIEQLHYSLFETCVVNFIQQIKICEITFFH